MQELLKRLSVEKWVVPSLKIAWHFHPEFKIVYVSKSSGIRFVGNIVSQFHPRDLVLVGSLLPHLWDTI
ncbi:hypothetical protein SAMN05216503_0470 [Polaribacter sp. KT25b]|uniref:hypothetical protein n=1 Tax=Polaribacter sp. KT25b TaxID=1855336 RepID=UPI00087D5789|nr:hypothetical protein [Polaribacter sp. KT25b]SDR69732.1 hypothetical protein SAMN05216503_0470 [Polaribacter sp. KT25b]